jgi:hypothetical protein
MASFTMASFTKRFGSMNSYEKFAFFDGSAYRLLSVLVTFVIALTDLVIINQGSKEAGLKETSDSLVERSADKMQSIKSLFINVAAAATLPYLYGAF